MTYCSFQNFQNFCVMVVLTAFLKTFSEISKHWIDIINLNLDSIKDNWQCQNMEKVSLLELIPRNNQNNYALNLTPIIPLIPCLTLYLEKLDIFFHECWFFGGGIVLAWVTDMSGFHWRCKKSWKINILWSFNEFKLTWALFNINFQVSGCQF